MMHQLEDYILVVENVLPLAVCDAILAEYGQGDDWVPAEVVVGLDGTHIDGKHRNCEVIHSSFGGSIAKNPTVRTALDKALFTASGVAIRAYIEKFRECVVQQDNGYDILKYDVGGFFNEHVDAYTTANRAVSCSFSLNDTYEGGEFSFFGGAKKYVAPKGAALLFPSNFLYPHAVLPVTVGTRYSVVTWFN